MKRTGIALLVTLALYALTTPPAADAQQAAKIWRIGYLSPSRAPTPTEPWPSTHVEAFRQGMRALGYIDGQHYVLETRFADAKLDRLPSLAADLLGLKVDIIIVTIGTPTVRVAKQATTTIPIVMAGSADPVEHGLVASLAHPGGNVTGVTHSPGPQIAGKGLQLLKEAAPKISRVAVLWDSSGIHEGPSLNAQQAVTPALGVTLLPHDVKTLDELTAALGVITRERADGLFVFPNFINGKHEDLILDFAMRNCAEEPHATSTPGPWKRAIQGDLTRSKRFY